MNYFTLLLSIVLSVGCSQGGGGGSSSSGQSDPMVGNTYFASMYNAKGDLYVEAFKIPEAGKIHVLYFKKPSGSSIMYYRKSIGTYSSSGSSYTVNYSYETCNPKGTESFDVKGDPADALGIRQVGSATTVKCYNDKAYYVSGLSATTFAAATEDISCNLVVKNEKGKDSMLAKSPEKIGRAPASEKAGWLVSPK